MSAYIVSRHHIVYLAQYAANNCSHARYWVKNASALNGASLAQRFAQILAAENFRSIYNRYPDTDPEGSEAWKGVGQVPGDTATADPFTLSEIEETEFQNFTPAQVAAAASCYDYQACEADEYCKTDAFAIITAIRATLLDCLVEGMAVEAEWDAPNPTRQPAHYAPIVEPEPEPEAPAVPAWFVESSEEPDCASRARLMLKKAGYKRTAVSVRCRHYSSIIFTVRSANVDLETVKAIASSVESISRCDYTHEILSGGNTFTSVEVTDEVKAELGKPFFLPCLDAIREAQGLKDGSWASVGDTGAIVGREGAELVGSIDSKRYWLPRDIQEAAESFAYSVATYTAS